MKRCGIAAALIVIVLNGSCFSQKRDGGGIMVWQDEFDGAVLDASKWKVEEGIGGIYGLNDWGNNEAQFYRKENSAVHNGVFTITAKKEKAGNKQYTSARISTNGTFSIARGRVEARIKMPKGKGMWPAFWLLGEGFPKKIPWPRCGEIDIAEIRGGEDGTLISTAHYGTNWRTGHYARSESFDTGLVLANAWHIYGVEWNETGIRWFFDGAEYFSVEYAELFEEDSPVKDTFDPDRPFFIILNLAVGGDFLRWDLPPDSVFKNPSDESRMMRIDWVRVWKSAP